MGKTGRVNKKYSAEFKLRVILDMRENHLSYSEIVRKYELGQASHRSAITRLHNWERIYLEEGELGLMKERRGQGNKGRPKKPLEPSVEEDLIAENQRLKETVQRLEMENEYLKKLDALIRAEEERNGKKPK